MSINNKRSYTEYTVTQPITDFAIGFENFDTDSKDIILVTLNGVDVSTLGYTVQRVNDLTIKITPAITEGTVRLTRETVIDEPFYKFTAGALFTAKSMDENFAQVRHSQQEVRDGFLYVQESALGAAGRAESAAVAANVATTATTVATGNTVAATATALTAASAANTAKTNADAATGRANTATSNANNATFNANNATFNANSAASDARAATVTTGVATGNANTAASAANAAADRVATVEAGKAAEITSVSASTVSPSTPASVVLGGTAQARTFAFKIPKGDTGAIALSNVQGNSSTTGISQKGFTDYVTLVDNAASRKVGTAAGNVVERGADGYPTNNNAIGVGQTWQDMTASRRENTVYTNSTGRPIVVLVTFARVSGSDVNCIVNNVNIARISTSDVGEIVPVTFIVPTGNTYKLETASILDIWSELR